MRLTVRHRVVSFLLAYTALAVDGACAGTFIDRPTPHSVRVATWNIYNDSVFADVNAARSARFARVAKAIAPDVWNFQEMYNHSSSQVKSLLDAAQPLGTPAGWHVYKPNFDEHVIASRYPLSMTSASPNPGGFRQVAMALVDLPDDLHARDLYVMNAHYKCCGGYDDLRQRQSDAFVNWMRDARTPGGSIDLPAGTPMTVLGDLNIVETNDPLDTLLNGDIAQNAVYGADSPPDWDGSANSAAPALHNATGPADYTWRDDFSEFDPGRLDYITYTDSVMTLQRSFVLNTVTMSVADRAAAGLLTNDSVYSGGGFYDHLPVVADFLIPAPIASDFNNDGLVNANDLLAWQEFYGTSGTATRAQGDADGDQAVAGSDFLVWQRQVTGGSDSESVGAALPEPAGASLLLLALVAFWQHRGVNHPGPRG